MLTRLFGSKEGRIRAEALYASIVAQARQPAFYQAWQVPDTVDGRFEMVALHAFLVMHRLKTAAPAARARGQDLFDTMFADMDRSLREMGAGDLGVGRRVKAMAQGFYGRIAAYENALAAAQPEALAAALRRNVYGTLGANAAPSPRALAALSAYVRAAAAMLARESDDELIAGRVRFPATERPGEWD
jgi:cytochrome b pre-mRNA-processing protein 3